MDHMDILRRSLRLAWQSKALWLFGALLFLTGGGGFNFPRGGQVQWHTGRGDWPPLPPNWEVLLVGALCLFLILMPLALLIRYIAETGLYRLIDEKITRQRPVTVRRGFELGWNQRALRLFGIDLVIGIPFFLFALLIITLALSPLLLLLVDSSGLRVVAIVLAIGFGLIALLILAIIGAIVGVWRQLVARRAVLDDQNWATSLRDGYTLLVGRLRDIVLMALLMWGVAIGWAILLLPVILFLSLQTFIFAGGPAWLMMKATGLPLAAALVGIPIGLVVFLLPLAVIQGAYQAFHATVWTITYRELSPALEPIEPTAST